MTFEPRGGKPMVARREPSGDQAPEVGASKMREEVGVGASADALSIISDGSQMFHIWLPSQRRFAANEWSNGLRRRLMSAIFGGSVVRLFIRFSRNRGLFRLIIHSLGLVNASRRLMKQSRQQMIACAFSGGDSRPSGRFCRSGESKRRKDENHSRQGHGDPLPSGINRQTVGFH